MHVPGMKSSPAGDSGTPFHKFTSVFRARSKSWAGGPGADEGVRPAPRLRNQAVRMIRINVMIIRMPAVKKTWLIDPDLVRRARKICGARTETETVTRALEEIVVRDEIDKAFRIHGPVLAGIENVFPDRTRRR